MRILNSVYGDSTGGRWLATLKTAELLLSKGNEVFLLIDPQDLDKIPTNFPKNITIVTLRNHGHWDLMASYKAREIIKKERIDLCICHSGRAIYMLKRAAWRHCPVVAYNHSHNIKRTLSADAFICITPFMQSIILKSLHQERPTAIISNAVSIPDNSVINPINNKIFTVGAVARMVRNKGLHHLLDALFVLKKSGIIVRARIAGDGEERDHLFNQCRALNLEAQVDFIGWISAHEKNAFYNSIDLMCFTSEWDVQPLVILESFAYGKPLIGTNVDGPSSMYTHLETAYVVPAMDPSALSKGIQALQADINLMKKISTNGRLKAIEHHSDKNIAIALDAFCKSLITNY